MQEVYGIGDYVSFLRSSLYLPEPVRIIAEVVRVSPDEDGQFLDLLYGIGSAIVQKEVHTANPSLRKAGKEELRGVEMQRGTPINPEITDLVVPTPAPMRLPARL